MINLTLCALSTSFLLKSPLLTPSICSKLCKFNLNHLNTNHFATNFLYGQSDHNILISHSGFNKFIKSPIKIDGESFSNQVFESERKEFTDKNILSVYYCTFNGCSISYDGGDVYDNIVRGGAIYYAYDQGSVTVYGSLFDNCQVTNGDGGALFICGTKQNSGYDMSHTNIKKFDSSYCCYAKCFATTRQDWNNEKAPSSGYGPIMLTFADTTSLIYSSSVNPDNADITSYGAQFDLTSSTIESKYINSTNGKSVYCAGIEYRKVQEGSFMYQTLVGLEGTTICSFRNLASDVSFSICNLVNNKVSGGIFNVDECIINVTDFCFLNIEFTGTDSKFLTGKNNGIILIDCYIDKTNEGKLSGHTTQNIHFYEGSGEKHTNEIKLLNLGSCGGDLAPPPTPSVQFTYSEYFSQSGKFTYSDAFSKSFDFTKSDAFQKTSEFTKSDAFQKTSEFKKTNEFTKSDSFTSSNKFSKSFIFSESHKFSHSDEFTNSQFFGLKEGPAGNANKGNKVATYAGIAAAVVGALIIAIVAFFVVRSKLKNKMGEEDAEVNETNSSSVNTANPLYGEAEDDPFKEDFMIENNVNEPDSVL